MKKVTKVKPVKKLNKLDKAVLGFDTSVGKVMVRCGKVIATGERIIFIRCVSHDDKVRWRGALSDDGAQKLAHLLHMAATEDNWKWHTEHADKREPTTCTGATHLGSTGG